jgi:hypothetical protein
MLITYAALYFLHRPTINEDCFEKRIKNTNYISITYLRPAHGWHKWASEGGHPEQNEPGDALISVSTSSASATFDPINKNPHFPYFWVENIVHV